LRLGGVQGKFVRHELSFFGVEVKFWGGCEYWPLQSNLQEGTRWCLLAKVAKEVRKNKCRRSSEGVLVDSTRTRATPGVEQGELGVNGGTCSVMSGSWRRSRARSRRSVPLQSNSSSSGARRKRGAYHWICDGFATLLSAKRTSQIRQLFLRVS
jgi:hypothetical protein